MNARVLLLAAVAAVLALGGWFLFGSTDEPVETESVSTRQAEVDEPAPEDDSDLAVVAGADIRVAHDVIPKAIAATRTTFLPADHPWAGQLAGVKGRLIEEDGTPVPDLRVELVEADVSLLFDSEHSALGHANPEVAEAYTNAEGEFLLTGARDGAFHALNIDRGGGRATLRLVEQTLEHGKVTDLGDITLEAFGTLIGTVIDEDGEPVAGARIRAAAIPDIVVQAGVLDVREGIVITGDDDRDTAIEIPPVAFALLERLPVPTTTTRDDGSFRLEGVPLGMVSGGADKAGHIFASLGPVNVTPDEVDVGELELLFGRTVTGRVVDDLDEPVEGVEVVAGALHPLFDVAIMQPAGSTTSQGTFETEGVPEDGSIVAAIRRHKSESWTVAHAKPGLEHVEFVLPAARRLTCKVVDEAGEPVEGVDVRVRPSVEDGNEVGFIMNMAMGGRRPMETTRAKQIEPGVYAVDDLRLGQWLVEARAPGRAIVRETVELSEENNEIELVSPAGRNLNVFVTDAATGEPVKSAHASLLGPEGFLMTAFASAFTNESGRAKLGPLHPNFHDRTLEDTTWLDEIVVLVEHPDYGLAKAKVSADATEVSIEMPPSCTIEGRVTWAGASPMQVYMVTLRGTDDENPFGQVTMLPRTAITNVEGSFRITGLAPGGYELYLMERYFEGNPIKLLVDQREPEMVDTRNVTVDPTEPTFVDIELSPTGEGPKGQFGGRVTVDDRPLSGAKVSFGRREPDVVYTDSNGEFLSDRYSVLNGMRIKIEGEVTMPDGTTETRELHSSWKRPKADEVETINVDIAFSYVDIQTVDKFSGAPVSGVKLTLDGRNFMGRNAEEVETDSRGMAQVLLTDKRTRTVTATGDLYARSTANVSPKIAKEADGPVRLEMQPEIPCSGRVEFVEGVDPSPRMWMSVVTPGNSGVWSEVDGKELTFELEGLTPGDYDVQIWAGPGRGTLVSSFTLPEGGDTNLLLEFRPRDGSSD